MPYVAGITFAGLTAGSPVSAVVLSSDDAAYKHDMRKTVGESLESTLKDIVASFPVKVEQKVIISVPSFASEEEKTSIKASAKTAGIPVLYVWDNLNTVQRGLTTTDYPAQNELLLEISPSGAGARLVSTEVDEEIRMSDVAKEVFIKQPTTSSNVEALISQLVEPHLTHIKQIPTVSGSDIKKILVVDFASSTAVIDALKAKFPSTEIIVQTDVASHTAKASLHYYKLSLKDAFVTNVASLRVGIAKADGHVLTLIPRHHTLPQHQTATLTTAADNQTKATVRVLVGVSPRVAENTPIAVIALEGLQPKPTGAARIKVTIDVEPEGKTKIVAEEVLDGGATGVSNSVELKDVIDNELDADDVTAILEKSVGLKQDGEAEKAEEVWAGEEAQGALPEQ